ncbi:hypothetical protein [Bacillus sp. FSL K6-3431]|uniref:hypothetical protein n=1 Tax=Bacillus sp. FSL K6-3431 TaxID=2921500 RepID=UPI0030FB9BA5
MNKQSTRAFAFGLLISAMLLFIFNLFFIEKEKATISSIDLQTKNAEIEELKAQIGDLETNYEKLIAVKAKENEQTTKPDEPKVTSFELTISEGMSSKEISSQLEKAKIIPDAKAFNDFLGENKLQRYIQIGKYHLNNEMNFEQIADSITKEP